MEGYLQRLDAKDVSGVLGYYMQDSMVEWEGQAGPYAGIYNGLSNIRLLFASFIGNTESSNSSSSGTLIGKSKDYYSLTTDVKRSGESLLAGGFVMTIGLRQSWVKVHQSPPSWKLKHDIWKFKSVWLESLTGGAF
ncbi:MAG: hypothetical protein V3U49_02765 [Nitrososphaerales archaeon]